MKGQYQQCLGCIWQGQGLDAAPQRAPIPLLTQVQWNAGKIIHNESTIGGREPHHVGGQANQARARNRMSLNTGRTLWFDETKKGKDPCRTPFTETLWHTSPPEPPCGLHDVDRVLSIGHVLGSTNPASAHPNAHQRQKHTEYKQKTHLEIRPTHSREGWKCVSTLHACKLILTPDSPGQM